jgi:hypothetical protein
MSAVGEEKKYVPNNWSLGGGWGSEGYRINFVCPHFQLFLILILSLGVKNVCSGEEKIIP